MRDGAEATDCMLSRMASATPKLVNASEPSGPRISSRECRRVEQQ